MAEENPEGVATDPPPEKPYQHVGKRLWQGVVRSFDGMTWVTAKTLGLLRLFATTALFLIVIFVVWNAIQSAQTVVVKPFSVPTRMTGAHADAGRIVANLLKQELLDAEKDIANNINQGRDESTAFGLPQTITSLEQSYIQNANIKLPETGISIDDVVEFIAGIFGRENITGSVYEDGGKLFLQVELKGRIFLFARDLPEGDNGKSLHLNLLAEMLNQSRTQLLSVASASYNLYYYCSEVVDAIEHQYSNHEKLFEYCTEVRSDKEARPEKIRALHQELSTLNPRQVNGDPLSAHVLTLVKAKVQQKADLFCIGEAGGQGKLAGGECQPGAGSVVAMMEAPAPAPITPRIRLPESDALAAETAVAEEAEVAMAMVRPASVVDTLKSECGATLQPSGESKSQNVVQQSAVATDIDPQDMRSSNQAEGEATSLLQQKQFEAALERYQAAIRLNCRNANAWANMGFLFSRPDNPQRDLQQAQEALQIATGLNSTRGWMWYSLCETEAFMAADNLEAVFNNPSCRQARTVDPAGIARYDKLFHIAIGDEYFRRGQYEQADTAYRKSMQTDRKRDCLMQTVLTQLAALENTHGIGGAQAAACNIISDSYTLEDAAPSECAAALDAFEAGC